MYDITLCPHWMDDSITLMFCRLSLFEFIKRYISRSFIQIIHLSEVSTTNNLWQIHLKYILAMKNMFWCTGSNPLATAQSTLATP